MSNPLQVLAGIAFVFFLPGYTLVNMLFPRRGELDPEYDIVYRAALGMGLSIVVAILVGFMLNAISSEGHGYVTAGPLWGVLVSVTLVFVLVGWLRGAYPRAGLIHPSLYRPPSLKTAPWAQGKNFEARRRTDRLIREREQLLVDIKTLSAQASATSNPQRSVYYRKRIDQARERVSQINEDLGELMKEGT
jgi:MFS family permease